MKNNSFDYSYHYNNWHCDTAESENNDINYAKFMFRIHNLLPIKKSAKILEIGCGMGRYLKMLRNAGYNDLTGIDIDESQIEIARRNEKNIFLSDAYEFLIKDKNKYDAIYMFDVLEHIAKEEQLPLLNEIKKHLTQNGFVAICVPCATCPTANYYRYLDFTHVVSYTRHSIGFLLHNAGLHYYTVRPQYQESERIQMLKLPWARLYRDEFGIADPILTANLVAVAFQNEDAFKKYIADVPEIHNDYAEPQPPQAVPEKPRGIKRLWKHIREMKF